MAVSYQTTKGVVSAKTRRRRSLAWWLAVLLVGVTIGAVATSFQGGFEEQARERIRAALDSEGLAWTQVGVDGRSVRLTGKAPGPGLGGQALDIVRDTRCSLLLISVRCASSVSADFGRELRGEEVWPKIEGSVGAGVLTLTGEIPDRASRDIALSAAMEGVGTGRLTSVVDRLSVTQGTPPRGFQPLIKRLARALSLCTVGQARVANGKISLRCKTPPAQEAPIRELMATPLPAGSLEILELELAGAAG